MIAWIFDLDGVLVHLESHKVVEHQIIDFIIKHLMLGGSIALISGRNVIWQRDNVVSLIKKELDKENINAFAILDNLFLSGEFGGTNISFKNGKEIHLIDNNLLLPKDLILEAKKITTSYSSDFVVDPKRTIFTVFTHSIDTFSQKADNLIAQYKKLLIKHDISHEFEVHKDTTAINIKYKKANKRYATKQVISWIDNKNINIEKYIAFGDSASDLEIGEELKFENLPFEFVFVGLLNKLNKKPAFSLIQTAEKFDKGTLEYLKQI